MSKYVLPLMLIIEIRMVSGLAIEGLSVLVPMYQGESSPAHIRGAIVWKSAVASNYTAFY